MERYTYEKISLGMQESLEHRIARCTHAMVALKAYAMSNPDFTADQFLVFAANVMPDAPEIRCLQLAPGGVVQYLCPPEGNEAALGLDLLIDSRESDSAREAIRLGKIVGAGPYQLRQGGLGLIFRLPIFEGETKRENFWGFAIAVIDVPPLLELSGVNAKKAVDFALRPLLAADQSPGDVFHGDSKIFDQDPVLANIGLPSGSWQLALRPAKGWGVAAPSLIGLNSLVILTAFAIGLGAWLILKQNALQKKQLLEIKTLQGILPICSSCKNIRDDEGYWVQVEAYVTSHTHAHFSHGICPSCMESLYGGEEWYKAHMGKVD